MSSRQLPGDCACSRYRTVSGKSTGCNQTTNGRFAPGHDAKLKAFLIAAGADGEDVYVINERRASALEYAKAIGYGDQVARGIDREIARRVAAELGDLGNARNPSLGKELADAARESDRLAMDMVREREETMEW